jgi:hypothetical protein
MQDLLRCAKHLFVAAMVAWVHPGLLPIGKSEDRGAPSGLDLSDRRKNLRQS